MFIVPAIFIDHPFCFSAAARHGFEARTSRNAAAEKQKETMHWMRHATNRSPYVLQGLEWPNDTPIVFPHFSSFCLLLMDTTR